MRAAYSYLRVLLACVGFVIIEPLAASWFAFLPEEWKFLANVPAALLGALASWSLFLLITPFTDVTFSWSDLATGVSATGPVLDIEARDKQPGQILALRADRATGRGLGRGVFRVLMKKGVSVVVTSNQPQLKFRLQSHSDLVTVDSEIVVRLGEQEHSTNSVPFDLGIRWDHVTAADLSANLKYRVRVGGGRCVSLLARLFVKVHPTIKEIRKVPSRV